MSDLTVRDPYGNEFTIDATARSFWVDREGYKILPGDEPKPAEPTPTGKKAASRPASDDKE